MEITQDLASQLGTQPPSQKGKFEAVLKAAGDPKVENSAALSSPQSVHSPLQNVIGSISKTENRLNEIVSLGLSGQQFSAQQLLTMQAGVYKATLAIDVVSKGVEQTTSGFKTVLQSQV